MCMRLVRLDERFEDCYFFFCLFFEKQFIPWKKYVKSLDMIKQALRHIKIIFFNSFLAKIDHPFNGFNEQNTIVFNN